jgi:acyl-CoA thioesterase FadM
MTEPFVLDYRARWSDMDWNQHMANAAFLGCAEDFTTFECSGTD